MAAARRLLSQWAPAMRCPGELSVATHWARSYAAEAALAEPMDTPEHEKDGKVLHPDLLNEDFRRCQYAVRGELYLAAENLRKAGREIIFTNVGNPQALGQKPITFNRQVHALVAAPFLLDHPNVADMFPADAISRAKLMLKNMPGGIGAYTDSRGAPGIRQEIADYLTQRDGFPSDPENIFLTDGASVAVRMMLNAVIRDSRDAILVPIPQYPLYSAAIQIYGGSLLPYYLDEEHNWALDMADLKSQVDAARAEGKSVRGLVFINPGNPTGQCLSRDNLEDLIKFAYDERVALMCDEVYQENVYQDERPFVSARRVMNELGAPYADNLEMVCFHTVSKGTLGECGMRGGYFEMVNVHPGVRDELYKVASVNMCPNTTGQVSMSLMMNGPQPGDESYEQYVSEKKEILASLRRRAHMMTDAFNSLEGVSCNFTEGAMYSFPRLSLPEGAVQAAKEAGKTPDTFYCLKLLEGTGISTVPGSGFGQQEGTFHMRTTILPSEEKIVDVCQLLKDFHKEFMDTYR